MADKKENISERKEEHLRICLNEEISFKEKSAGFEKYEFEHYAITEVDINSIDLSTDFFAKKISYPFMISCMTGGSSGAVNINQQLAIAARSLNIPIGVGSQRQMLENDEFKNSFKIVRKEAGNSPVLGNIGAAQIVKEKNPVDLIKNLVSVIEADAMVIHVNPLQELIQKSGESNFKGFIKAVEKICNSVSVPIIVKEVGAGISEIAAKNLLDAGVKGIDVSGAGGTSWSAVELLRNNSPEDEIFRDWGLPTSYCIRHVHELKTNHSFMLIASGGINSGMDTAKSLALGGDIAASAKAVLKMVDHSGTEGVIKMIEDWFEIVKKIMYLTGAQDLKNFNRSKLIKTEELY